MNKCIKSTIVTAILTFSLTVGISQKTNAAEAWYYSQDVTAQVAAFGTPMASGKGATWMYAAVHPKTWGSHTNPIFPFGSYIQPTQYIPSPLGGNWTTFQVEDIGDVNNTRGLTKYWFEVYYGDESNYDKAIVFGKQKRDYKLIY